MKLAFVFAILLTVNAFGSIHISHDSRDCLNGSRSMDVRVSVDNESFSFDPSCSFSFNRQFKTRGNRQCRAESRMCSTMSSNTRSRLEVMCSDGSRQSVSFECPKKRENVRPR